MIDMGTEHTKCLINLQTNLDNNKQYQSYFILVSSCGTPEHVWNNMKETIDDLSKNEQLTFQNFYQGIITYKDWKACTNDYGQYHNYIHYYIDVVFEDTVIHITAYNAVNYDKRIECFKNRYVFNTSNEGNCIDDFIRRGVEPLLDNIVDLKDSIKSRMEERALVTEYHNTWCFEKDFTQISLIKRQAQKIIENCDKHLERISDFYTKL